MIFILLLNDDNTMTMAVDIFNGNEQTHFTANYAIHTN